MKLHFTLLFTFTIHFVLAQNLVENPSFEAYTSCPTYVSEIKLAAPWGPARLDEGSTDYYNRCSQRYEARVPSNIIGYQQPRTGNGYVGFFVYYKYFENRTYREYAQGILKEPLEANHRYLVSFYVSRGDRVNTIFVPFNTAISNLGAYLSATPPIQESFPPEPTTSLPTNYYSNMPLIPQVVNPAGNLLTDTLGWTLVQGLYTATGGEQYITIGNFSSDAATEIQVIFPGILSSYYFLDDVSVRECSKLANLGNDTTICPGESLLLTAYLAGAEYTWQDGSKHSTYSVGAPGEYWVEVALGGCVSRDTIRVGYKESAFRLGTDTTLCSGQVLTLDASTVSPPYLWSDGSTGPTLAVSEPGQYWVKAYQEGCPVADTILVSFEAKPEVILGRDTVICGGQSFVLQPLVSGSAYQWSDGSSSSTLEVRQAGTYWVEVHGPACVLKDSIEVKVFDCAQDIPTVITPNGDGKNDTFMIKEIDKDVWQLEVFNRWGKSVYLHSNYLNHWGAEGLAAGVYYYQLLNTASRASYKGWIHVLR